MNKNKKRTKPSIDFPKKVLAPVAGFLKQRLKSLERSKINISQEDPFSQERRILDNASPDAEADEQFGHARTSAIKEQLEKKIIQTRRALARVRIGKYGVCEKCGKMIDTDRLVIYPEATVCVKCEGKRKK